MNRISTDKRKLKIGFKGIVSRTDESVMEMAYAKRAFNFAFRGGALKGDIGVESAKGYLPAALTARFEYPDLPAGLTIKEIFVYNKRDEYGGYDDRIIVHATDGYFYSVNIWKRGEAWQRIGDLNMSEKACAVSYNYNGKDVLLLSSEDHSLVIVDDLTVTTIPDAPRFSSVAVHFERIYGTVNGIDTRVWFSDDFNPANWKVSTESAGFINFADECGDMLKVVSFLNYLYIFREHGIFRLTAYAEQTEFSMKKLYTDTGRIFGDTIALCGDRIIFLAEEGLFSFNGYDVARFAVELPNLSGQDKAVGAYHDNCYYLACTLSTLGFSTVVGLNNALVQFDLRDKSLSVMADNVYRTLAQCSAHHATDLLIALGDDGYTNKLGMLSDQGAVFGKATRKFYESPCNDLMTDRLKIVRDVTLTSKFSVRLVVITDGVEHVYLFPGGPTAHPIPKTIFVGQSGKKIGFRLETENYTAYITPPIVNLEVM